MYQLSSHEEILRLNEDHLETRLLAIRQSIDLTKDRAMISSHLFFASFYPASVLRSSTAMTTGLFVLAVSLAQLAAPTARANPDGGNVVAGEATIDNSTSGRVEINQTSNRAAINWNGFSIDHGEVTNFNQPSANSVTLNRVTGGDLSTIAGQLTANGKIILVNPNGVIFTGSSEVNVGGLIASTSEITTDNFMAGNYRFTPGDNRSGTIINDGSITVGEGGLAAFVAPWVENNGVIAARLGRVELASGDSFTLDLHGDGLIQLALENDPGETPINNANNTAVNNTGRIEADGGIVTLTVGEAQGIVDRVVNMSGVIQAQTIADRGGKIILGGNDVTTLVAGKLDAAGRTPETTGGEVILSGRKVGLTETASIDVSGEGGGGKALIGGDFQGTPPIPTFRPAEFTSVAAGATVNADAKTKGDGGLVVAWADQATSFRGNASARGGASGGNGGLIETSGKIGLDVDGISIDASAVKGRSGNWLLDPANLTIERISDGGESLPFNVETGLFDFSIDIFGSRINPDTITAALAAHTDVTITTSIEDRPGETGIITIQDAIVDTLTSPSTSTLRLIADDDIVLNAPIISLISGSDGSGSLDIHAQAGHDIIFEDGSISTRGNVRLIAGAGDDLDGSIINNLDGSQPAVTVGNELVLAADTGIGTDARPLSTSSVLSIGGQTNSGGIYVDNSNSDTLYIKQLHYGLFDVSRELPPSEEITPFSLSESDISSSSSSIVTVDASKFRNAAGLFVPDPVAGDKIRLITDGNLHLSDIPVEIVGKPSIGGSGDFEIIMQATNGYFDYDTSDITGGGVIAASIVNLTAMNGINAVTIAKQLTVKNGASGEVNIIDIAKPSTRGTTFDITQSGGGSVNLAGSSSIGEFTITNLVAPASNIDISSVNNLFVTVPLGSIESRIGNVDFLANGALQLVGITSSGSQEISGGSAVSLAGVYDTDGKNFTVKGSAILTDTDVPTLINTSDSGAGGNVSFNGTLDGTLLDANDLTIRVGAGDVSFNDSVGGNVPLGILRIEDLGSFDGVTAGNVTTDEDQAVPLTIGDPDDASLESFILSGMPVGSVISDGIIRVDITTAGQVINLTEFNLDTLRFTPPANKDADIPLDVVTTVNGSSIIESPSVFNVAELISGEAVVNTFAVAVNPVADLPVISAPSGISASGNRIPLAIDVASPDDDGSEVLTVTISNLPSGASLSAGVINEDGTFTIPVSDLKGLELIVPNMSALPADLTIVAMSTDGASSNKSSPFIISVINDNPSPPPEPTIPASGGGDQLFAGDRGQQGPIGDAIGPNRTRDISPVVSAKAREESVEPTDPFAVEPAAGENDLAPDIWEACPDVVEASVSWQNTAPDAAFNVDPNLIPYSVDVYCGGYQLTAAGRGSAQDYQGLSFVTRDFWTDLKQEKTPLLIDELRGSLFLDDYKE